MYTLIFLAFIICSPLLYQVSSLTVLGVIACIEVVLMIAVPRFRRGIARFGVILRLSAIILALTFLMNLAFDTMDVAILYTFRLLILCGITYLFFIIIGSGNLARAVAGLFTPLKLFGVNTEYIYTIIQIALTSIPRLKVSIDDLVRANKAKGIKLGGLTAIRHPELVANQLIHLFFDLLTDLELALTIKGV